MNWKYLNPFKVEISVGIINTMKIPDIDWKSKTTTSHYSLINWENSFCEYSTYSCRNCHHRNVVTTWLHSHNFTVVHGKSLQVQNGFRTPGSLLHLDKKNIDMLFKSVAALQEFPFFARMKFTALIFWVREQDRKGVNLSRLVLTDFMDEVLNDFMHKVNNHITSFQSRKKDISQPKSRDGKITSWKTTKTPITVYLSNLRNPKGAPLK